MDYILLIVGFYLLIKGADIFVDGAAAISKKIGIPPIVIGLTIISLGTSAPELAVSIISSLGGNNEIAVGNVIGSNMFNTLVVLGTTIAIMPLIIQKSKIKKDFLINIGVTLVFTLLAFNGFIFNGDTYISRIDGVILVFLCLGYVLFLIRGAKRNPNKEEMEKMLEEVAIEQVEKDIKISSNVIRIIIGVVGIVIGGQLVVSSASNIALLLGMSEKLVGLTIVAIGTSLPELVTSVVAALKGEEDMALGNILGSNIFNILLIIGISSTISPMLVDSSLIFDFIFLIAITIFIGIIILGTKKETKKIGKIEGIIFISLYIAYMAFIISRN